MKKIIFSVVLACGLVSCTSVLLTGRKQLLLVNDSEVIASSFQSYKQYIDSVPPSTNKTQTALVKKVGNNIATVVANYLKSQGQESQIANFAWEFNLVKDTSVNAFCMPGGKVVFYDGILPMTKTEAGMAVVMGHEIAHAVARHSNERLSQQLIAQGFGSIVNMAASRQSQIVQTGIGVLYGLGAQGFYLLPYSRKQEYEADQLGLIFMAMAGYDPNEAVAFWERMAANNTGSTLEFMSTHPSDAKRIAQMKATLPEALQYYKK